MKKNLSEFMSVLIKWKNFIFFNYLIFLIALIPLLFVIPNYYRATTVITIPQDNDLLLGGLSGVQSGKINSKLFGLGSTSKEDIMLGILNNRFTLSSVINKYNLYNYYDADYNNIEKTLKKFKNDLRFAPNEYGFIEISVINKEPVLGANIANYFVKILDSLSIKFKTERAINHRAFIEKTYQKILEDLRVAEDTLQKYQSYYNVFVIPEQFKIAIKESAELEAKMVQSEITLEIMKNNFGIGTPEFENERIKYEYLYNRIKELNVEDKLQTSSNIFFPFSKMPEINSNYLRLVRNVETQVQILELILPIFEQSKIEAQRNIPIIQVIDKAFPSVEIYSPKRVFILVGLSSLYLFFIILLSFKGESVINRKENNDMVEIQVRKLFNYVIKLFKVKSQI